MKQDFTNKFFLVLSLVYILIVILIPEKITTITQTIGPEFTRVVISGLIITGLSGVFYELGDRYAKHGLSNLFATKITAIGVLIGYIILSGFGFEILIVHAVSQVQATFSYVTIQSIGLTLLFAYLVLHHIVSQYKLSNFWGVPIFAAVLIASGFLILP